MRSRSLTVSQKSTLIILAAAVTGMPADDLADSIASMSEAEIAGHIENYISDKPDGESPR